LASVVHLLGNVSKVPIIFAGEIENTGLGALLYFGCEISDCGWPDEEIG